MGRLVDRIYRHWTWSPTITLGHWESAYRTKILLTNQWSTMLGMESKNLWDHYSCRWNCKYPMIIPRIVHPSPYQRSIGIDYPWNYCLQVPYRIAPDHINKGLPIVICTINVHRNKTCISVDSFRTDVISSCRHTENKKCSIYEFTNLVASRSVKMFLY